MSFRTIVITRQSKISYKNRFLVVKKENEERYVHLSEIDTIVVDSISVSLTSYLLKELADNKIKSFKNKAILNYKTDVVEQTQNSNEVTTNLN